MNRLSQCLLCSGLVLASGVAFADGSGTFYDGGQPIALKGAYAFRMPDPFDKGKQITRVVFADQPIDASALKNARDRDEAIDGLLRGATRVDLNIEGDGSLQNVNTRIGNSSGSQSGSGWYTLSLKHNDDKRVEGTFRSNDEADKQSGRYYDLAFALDLPGAPDLGAALPANGGEQGKVYLAYLATLKKGDVDALVKFMSKERADELLAHRNDKDFKMMFGFIQGQALRDAKFVKGNSSGDAATLEYAGKDGDGNATTSVVSMVRQAGSWKVEKESTSTSVR